MYRVLTLALTLVAALFNSARADRVALIVGVEDYSPTELRPLKYAESDAKSLASRLELMGFHVILMTGDQRNPDLKPSTPARILDALNGRINGLESRDTLIVAMTGHGVQFTDELAMETGAKETYFCPESARLNDKSTLLPIAKQVLRRIHLCRAGRKLVLIDACRNNISPKATDLAARLIPLDSVGDNPRILPKGMSVLYSCSGGQKSWEHDDLRHSVFSNFVLEYFAGNGARDLYDRGQPNVDGLITYVRSKTNRFVLDRIVPSGQLPELVGDRESWPIALGTTADAFTNSVGKRMIRINGGVLIREWEPERTEIPTLLVSERKVTVGDFRQFVDATGYQTVAELASSGSKQKLLQAGVKRAALDEYGITSFYGLAWNSSFDPEQDSSTENEPFARNSTTNWRKLSWPQTDDHPVTNLSPIDIQAYLDWLSRLEGRNYSILDDCEFEWVHFGDLPYELKPSLESGPPQTEREKRVWAELRNVLAANPPMQPGTKRRGLSYYEVVSDYGWWGQSWIYGTASTARKSSHPSGLVGLAVNFPELHSNSFYPESDFADCSNFFDQGSCFASIDSRPYLATFRLKLEP